VSFLFLGLCLCLTLAQAHKKARPDGQTRDTFMTMGGKNLPAGSKMDDPRYNEKLDFGLGKPGTKYNVHNQQISMLKGKADEDLSSPEAWEALKCNACLVTTVEIAQTLREYWQDLEKRVAQGEEKRKLKKQEAIDVMRSTCNDDSLLSKMGLITESTLTRNVFYHQIDKAHLEKAGYALREDPAIRKMLQAECTLLLDEYMDDFLIIISRNHQNLELQNNLCSPAPGIHHCDYVEPDWIDREEIAIAELKRKRAEYRRRVEEVQRDFDESPDPLAYLYEEQPEPKDAVKDEL